MSNSLAEQVARALNEAVDRYSLGLSTTIYADDIVLQSINASVAGGISSLLGSKEGKARARSIKQLDSPASCLPDGTHALFLLGSASWSVTAWPLVAQKLQGGAFTKCTLCVATSEQLWHDVEAAFPGHSMPLTRAGVSTTLLELLRQGQHAESKFLEPSAVQVQVLPLLSVAALCGDCFVLTDLGDVVPTFGVDGGASCSRSMGNSSARDTKPLDRASLGIVSLLSGLGLEGSFYSLGDMSKRISRRCAGMAQRTKEHGSERATVVIVDRTLDLVAPMHHGGHLLDQLYRALPESTGSSASTLTRQSLLSVLREDENSAMSLWETCFEQDRPVALQILRRVLVGHLADADVGGRARGTLPSTAGKVTGEQLQSILDIYQDLDAEQVEGVLDITRAVADSMSVGERERWSEIESAEKTLKLVMGGIKDSLLETADSIRCSGSELAEGLEEEEEEMSAAWDQVLTSIPPLSSGMIESCVKRRTEDELLASAVPRWLWQHTPAPGMMLMAASLLAPTRVGIPAGQRAQAERRLTDDYVAIYLAVAHGGAGDLGASAVQVAAERWAARVMECAERVAVSEGQRSRMAQWGELVGLSRGMDGVYLPLAARVAEGVLRGEKCADLEYAEQGTAVAAANMLKGLG
ncbi:Sec1 domain-containing protein 2 [Coemansia spiralis]|uniref:Sec1 domain-containing protein 2 n=1 Tax=Coemansia spiralis TaxID=417178 RepID=A0A9W8GJC1_9FUNG|nr:Sec1 domain-containing protein 2 [Coemansia spiralis]